MCVCVCVCVCIRVVGPGVVYSCFFATDFCLPSIHMFYNKFFATHSGVGAELLP